MSNGARYLMMVHFPKGVSRTLRDDSAWQQLAVDASARHGGALESMEAVEGDELYALQFFVLLPTPSDKQARSIAEDIHNLVIAFDARATLTATRPDGSEIMRLVPSPPSRADDALELWIDPGNADAETIAGVLAALSDLHRAEGGSGFVYHTDGELVVPAEVEAK